jgi:hypothetical protein
MSSLEKMPNRMNVAAWQEIIKLGEKLPCK